MRALASARCARQIASVKTAWRPAGRERLDCPWMPSQQHQLKLQHPAAAARSVRALAAAAGNGCGSDSDSEASSSCAGPDSGWLLDVGPVPSCDSASSAASLGSSNSGGGGEYDAIMMLGGGLLPNGGLPEWVVRRLEGCRHLYLQQAPAAVAAGGDGATAAAAGGPRPWAPQARRAAPIVLLGAGTPHKPAVIDQGGFVLHESTAYAAYLLRRGVPAIDLLKEVHSYDTVGNAYFSLLIHALPAGWRRIAVVTSDFHMPRTAATFDFVYGLAGRCLHGDADWFSLDYRPVSDAGIFDPEVLQARVEKEAAAVAAWRRNTAGLQSLADLHAWLYATHLCYSVSRQHEFGHQVPLDPRLAASY